MPAFLSQTHAISPSLTFFQRPFPSANMCLIHGERPILIDTGFQTDLPDTLTLLETAGTPPAMLSLIANTHYHCDHNGGNYHFHTTLQIPIAAHPLDMRLINTHDRDACAAEWLAQPIEPYWVNVAFEDGEVLDTIMTRMQVIYAPGHTLGHLAFYLPDEKILVCGDTFHADDVAWLSLYREGVGAIHRMIDTLDRFARLDIDLSISGHGAACSTPHKTIAAARKRYEKWIIEPQKVAWHACKRIFAYALMLAQGMTNTEIETYLLASPWYADYCRFVFDVEPINFIAPLIEECKRSGAASWRDDGKLYANAPYNPPPPGWKPTVRLPHTWTPS